MRMKKTPSGKKLMSDLYKKISGCQVTVDTHPNTRKQVNGILLALGKMVPKSCKLPNNDHLFKNGNEVISSRNK